jgi:5'-methylthioadenosine phosphorylase
VPEADVGVFGGSGFYSFLDRPDLDRTGTNSVEAVTIDTPYGATSAPITIGDVRGRRVAFLPRHGRKHELPPHRIPYRANLWAMRELGVRAIVGPCAAGSLQPHVHPGELVVVDQLVDRTSGRSDTFFDGPEVHHVAFADPYDSAVRSALVAAARRLDLAVHDGGTMVVVQGPRFSTRAESRWFTSMGWEVVNMTGYPEAVLAAELAIPYAAVALITDYDVGLDGVEGVEPVTHEMVFAFFEGNLERVRALLFEAIPSLP